MCEALYGLLHEIRTNRGASKRDGKKAKNGALGAKIIIAGASEQIKQIFEKFYFKAYFVLNQSEK